MDIKSAFEGELFKESGATTDIQDGGRGFDSFHKKAESRVAAVKALRAFVLVVFPDQILIARRLRMIRHIKLARFACASIPSR